MSDDNFQAVYACKQHPGFSFRIAGRRYKFEKHQLILQNKDEVEELDEFLASNVGFAAKIKKVTADQAESLVAQHKKAHGGAHSGMFPSNAMSQNEANKLSLRDAMFDSLPDAESAELTEALAADSLVATEKAPVPAAFAGFKIEK